MIKNIVFISIDGMTDTLGQSQVLPYLVSSSRFGYSITIISCEKSSNFKKNESVVTEITSRHHIKWKYCFYQQELPIVSQIKNFYSLKKLVKEQLTETNNVVLHCRSYLPALIGLQLKRKYNAKFIFDMRGFWADERIDGNIWKLNNPAHKFLYNYFKRMEKKMIEEADYIVTLTNTAKQIVSSITKKNKQIKVIPCCADVDHFKINTKENIAFLKKKLSINEDDFVVGYLGSIGTWYMLDEMLDFFIEIKKQKSKAILFFVTPDNSQQIIESANKKNVPLSAIRIESASREEVPQFISTFNIGLFFIRPSFSKKGSSPTKLAELLACGIPIITNALVGDVDEIITKNNCGVLVKSFDVNSYKEAIKNIEDIIRKPAQELRNVSLQNFLLEHGAASYKDIYESLF